MKAETNLIEERLRAGLYWVFDLPDWVLFVAVTLAAMLVTLVSWRIVEIMLTKPGLHQSSISSRKLRLRIGAGGAVIGAILALLLAQPWKDFMVSTMIAEPPTAAGPALPTSHAQSPLGMNLAPIFDYNDEDPFLDFFKLSRGWIPLCVPGRDAGCTTWWDTGEKAKIQLDEYGWVTSLPKGEGGTIFTRVAALLLTGGAPHDYTGDYVVLYDGEGEMTYSIGATKLSGSPGRDLIRVASDGNVRLTIVSTDPQGTGNYIRNIRVVRSDREADLGNALFNPAWLARLEPFNTLRFMDWMRTNGSQQQEFSNRPQEADARYSTEKGVPIEVMVKLANVANSEPWFNMPHKATDDYVRQFADKVRGSLNPHLRVYVEYSNEVWNTMFSQGQDIENWAQTELPGGSASGYTKRINWFGKRSAQVCQIWKEAFGDEASRVVCVLGAQAANTWTATEALDCPLYRPILGGKTCQEMGLQTVAIGPYFGHYLGTPAFQSQVREMTLDDLFAEITHGGVVVDTDLSDWIKVPTGGALEEAYSWMDNYDAMAAARDFHVVAYEGGQHLAGVGSVANDGAIEALFKAANRDPRMGEAYAAYLEHWRSAPNGRLELFVPFLLAQRYTKWGSWGTLEHIDQAGSPKYDALVGFAGTQPCGWTDCAIVDPSAPQTLTMAVSGGGEVTSNPAGISCGSDCTEPLPMGTLVTLSARPEPGQFFAGWSGACAGTTTTCTVMLNGPRKVMATFQTVMYPLDVKLSGAGGGAIAGGGIDCGSVCAISLAEGTVVTLTASPANGTVFTGWSGACAGTAPTCTVMLAGPKSVGADFQPIMVEAVAAPDGLRNGLAYTYFEGLWNSTAQMVAAKPRSFGQVDQFSLTPQGNDNPNPGNAFGFVFDGYLDIPEDGLYQFSTESDDGSRLWIGGNLIVDNDGLHKARTITGSIGLRKGLHPIRVAFFENWGKEILKVTYRTPKGTVGAIPVTALHHSPSQLPAILAAAALPSSAQSGMASRYYEGTWSVLPDFAALTPLRMGTLTNFKIQGNARPDLFGFRYDGYINIPQTGFYDFYTRSDDGSRLWIDEQLVVDNDGLHGAKDGRGTLGLAAGWHRIRVGFFERTGGEILEVSWKMPGGVRGPIPDSALAFDPAP